MSASLCTTCNTQLHSHDAKFCHECGSRQPALLQSSVGVLTGLPSILNLLYGRAGVAQNWSAAVGALKSLSDSGDHYAMALYGWALWDGIGVPQDWRLGEELLQRCTHPLAQVWCLLFGIGRERDAHAAFKILTSERVDKSDEHVLYLLGRFYAHGDGCDIDFTAARVHYELAGNHIVALCDLGDLYRNGSGVPPDESRALQLYCCSAQQGYRTAQYRLGWCYENAEGVERDMQQAVQWYTRAAEQGSSDAQFQLGGCYEEGEGVQRDVGKAMQLYVAAAEQDHTQAKSSLKYLQATHW
eukprot:TRINITY_DN6120_c0_g2_i1.p1 TRINITY_DN6120_c0_g2~~TRINITY_DN6120_c0_g2_i1.p1  ORF type:complete len:326 (+),score=38.64 TRINITY_DN6120_c0_g2_i1:82-978(+)